ncbi:hypothetical protein ACJJTC_018212 [Scirpophaga incertulas]
MGSVTAPVLRASGGPTRAYIVADGFHAWVLSQLRCCGPPAVPRGLISSQMVFMHGFCHSSGAAGLRRSHASLYRRTWFSCMDSVTAPVLRASGGPTRAYVVADGFHAWVLSQLRCCGPPAVPRELISSQMVFMHGFCHSSGAAGLRRSHASLYRRRWFSCMGSVTAPVLRASGGPTRAYIVADGFRSPPQLRLYGRLLSSRAAISKELRYASAPSKATALAKGSIPSTSSRPSRTFSEVTVRPVGAIGEMEMSLVGASHIPVVSPVKPIHIDIDVLAQALAAAGVSGGSASASAAASAAASVAAGAAAAPAAAGLTAVGEGQLSAAGAVSAAGSALVSGALPATGLVSFQGLLPAAGSVILAGNCGCGCPVCAA